MPMDQTIPDLHLTLSVEKNFMKWSKFETTDVTDDPEHSNISSSGREAQKATTHGNQLTKSLPWTYCDNITNIDRSLG